MAGDSPPKEAKMAVDPKHPEKAQRGYARYYSGYNNRSGIGSCLTVLLIIIGIIALTVYLVYRPHKPQFTVVGAAIYDLNATSPPFISTSMQFTLLARNPNPRTSIYYDRLSIYVAYRDQMITPPMELPPLHHTTKTTVAVAPVLGGPGVPVSAEVARGLQMDEAYGVVQMRVVMTGKLRWKGGAIKTGRYGLYVKCDVWLGLKRGSVGEVPLLGAAPCHVDV